MKAALLHGARDLRIEYVETPSIRNDEILVRVRACGICGTDLHTYKTGKDVDGKRPLPILIGHEFSGEVVEAGSLVNGVAVGDRVVGNGHRNCGECWWCKNGRPQECRSMKVPGAGLDGAFAEFVVVPNPQVGVNFFIVPEGLGWEEAATIEPASVACWDVRHARLRQNETVVILGAGMIGQCIAQICKATSDCTVIVSEPNPFRMNVAQSLGADAVLDPTKTDLLQFVQEYTKGGMAGVVFECAGFPAALEQAVSLLRYSGKLMQVAMTEKDTLLTPELHSRVFQWTSTKWIGCGGQRWDMAVDLLGKGLLKTRELVTHRYPLERILEAFETQATAKDAIKVIVEP